MVRNALREQRTRRDMWQATPDSYDRGKGGGRAGWWGRELRSREREREGDATAQEEGRDV